MAALKTDGPNVNGIIKDVGNMPISKLQGLIEEINTGKLKVGQGGAEKIWSAIGQRAGVLIQMDATVPEKQMLNLMMNFGRDISSPVSEEKISVNSNRIAYSVDPIHLGTRLDLPKDWDYNPHEYINDNSHNPG